MRKIFIGLGIVIVLLIAAIAVLPQLIPSSVYKDKIQTELSRELGRDVTIKGDVKLAVFPTIKARTDRVEIANPDGFNSEMFAAMEGLDAKVKLWPLFAKRVEIKSFTLNSPVINLEKNTAGEPNWLLGAPKTEQENPEPEGPFKRDGRYANINPAIGLFAINQGTITFADATKPNADFGLTDVNIAFAVPSLAKPVKIDGNLKFNSDPMDISLLIDSPRAFLDGQNAPITLDFKAPYANISAKGEFLQSERIAFAMNMEGTISDVAALTKRLPMDVPYAGLAKSVTLKGDYSYDGTVFSAKGADVKASGDLFDASYKGGGALTKPPTLTGNVSANVKNIPALAKIFDIDVQGLDLVRTANLSAALTSAGTGFDAKNIDATVGGDGINAAFKGSGRYGDALSANGTFTANAASIPEIVKALNLDLSPAAALGDAAITGTLSMQGETITAKIEQLKSTGPYLDGTFIGDVAKSGEALTAKGTFTAKAKSLKDALDIAGFDIQPAKAIGQIDANGQLAYDGKTTQVSGLTVSSQDGVVTGNFAGDVAMADVLSVTGKFDTAVSSLSNFRSATGMTVPYARSVGAITASGDVSGKDKSFTIANLNAALSDGQINGTFKGNANTQNGFTLGGRLSADIPSLRAVASEGGTQLPPSTEAGTIFEGFSVTGDVSGTPSDITFKNADVAMDHLKGKGDFTVDMKQSKPFVNGTLDMDGLDLRPYMASYAAQNPTGKIQPWNEEPIPTAPLNAVDADFKLTTPNIKTDRVSLGKSDINAKLRGGVLTADFPNVSLYGGAGSMRGIVNAAGAVPTVEMTAKLNNLESESFLGALAGFTNASGEAGTGVSFKGSGASIADIMKSLDGDGNFKMVDGKIAGIDLGEFMTGIDAALTSRSLPSGIGSTYATKFKDIIGLFTIENGVAKVGKFSLDGAGVLAEGQGQIDLGNQKIDFSLRPRLTGENASDLASFGIPIRLTGDFGGVKPSLDTDLLAKIAVERAKTRAKDELQGVISDNVGGTAGEILGGILGGGSTAPAAETPTSTPAGEIPATAPEDAVKDVLGGLLGGEKQPTPTPPADGTQAPPPSQEPEVDPVESVIKGLFGKKKKKEAEPEPEPQP